MTHADSVFKLHTVSIFIASVLIRKAVQTFLVLVSLEEEFFV